MFSDDTVYVGFLVLSFLFSFLFRKVKHKNVKQWMSTIYGTIIVLQVSGLHIAHPIICTLVNAVLIQVDKRYSSAVYICICTIIYSEIKLSIYV